MKALGSLWHKYPYSLKSASEGLSPVVGSLLLLLITFALVGAIVSSINLSGSRTNFQPPVARITLESCEGGLYGTGPANNWARFEENQIVLMHEGGDSLPLDSISIRISGYGRSYRPVFGEGSLTGDISILYKDLSSRGKNSTCYVVHNNATLEDGSWDVGEKLVLCGQDSAVGARESSVKVSVNGDDKTSDNYGFKAGTEITLKIIDRKGRNVIAERKAVVKLAD
ncbi:type IV pilin [Methanosarcina sp. DH2]|uniref:type IV pilin N-terminal domain-containing protein n=1 Tax=Methanosarcina sp. DH2 TaxID=2605639 RepID=UPI001E54932E|nr:type IV pilin N-terminal domain-containing protein [Methanosarcina sp. DH2]MCC4769859.1 type IV pilin [Methanosarcina sp. DH2]